MYCLFWIKNKLLFKHMPDIAYMNVAKLGLSLMLVSKLQVYAYIHGGMCTCMSHNASSLLLDCSCTIVLFIVLFLKKKSTNSVPAYFIQALYFVFHSNRVTQHFWKASGFQTACQRPKKVLVALLLLLLEEQGGQVAMPD